MEVNRTNFQKVLQDLDEVLNNASFLAIDTEFTGLSNGPDASAFDTPAQYYAKVRSGSMDFLLVQFGLSIFTYDKTTESYVEESYNFYVFPKPLNRAAPDCRFTCQASSMTFLAENGFDFNKLFKLGIPYLTKADEEKLQEKMIERQKVREDNNQDLIPIPEEDKKHVEDICSSIDDFLKSDAEELTIDKCNAFIRRIINQEARIRWPGKIRLDSKRDSSGQYLIVQKLGTKEEEERKETERKEKERNELKEAVGLSALLRKISDSGKLIVGHNMLLDLCHIIRQFFTPLPESYREFKSLVNCLFPKLLDTKFMSQSSKFKDTIPCSILNALHDTVSKPPFRVPKIDAVNERSYNSSSNKYHEAGYDAYVTGLCFISMSNYLGFLQTPIIDVVLPDSWVLKSYINKLMMNRLKDFPYIDLTGKDPTPSRDHVFYITFPKEWKLSDITQIFSPFGGAYISWLSDTSAYVSLNKRDQSSAVKKKRFNIPNFTLKKYSEHQAALEAENSSLEAGGNRKRKLCSTGEDNSPGKNDDDDKKLTTGDDDGWEMASGGKRRRNRKFGQNSSATTGKSEETVDNDKPFAESESWG